MIWCKLQAFTLSKITWFHLPLWGLLVSTMRNTCPIYLMPQHTQALKMWGSADMNFSTVQSLSHVQLFVTPWTAVHQASLSITNSQSLFKLMSLEPVMPFNHVIFCFPPPFSSCLQSFPASGPFPMSQFLASGEQSIGDSASASVLPMNIYQTDFL